MTVRFTNRASVKNIRELAFLILFFSCNNIAQKKLSNGNTEDYDIFQPKYNLTYHQLLKNGFKVDKAVDVLSLFKDINDSTELRYFLSDSTKKVAYEFWIIQFPKNISFNEIESFIKENGSVITSSYCAMDDTVSVFYATSLLGGLDFKCVYGAINSSKALSIEHKHPHYYDFYKSFEE